MSVLVEEDERRYVKKYISVTNLSHHHNVTLNHRRISNPSHLAGPRVQPIPTPLPLEVSSLSSGRRPVHRSSLPEPLGSPGGPGSQNQALQAGQGRVQQSVGRASLGWWSRAIWQYNRAHSVTWFNKSRDLFIYHVRSVTQGNPEQSHFKTWQATTM